MAYNNGYGGGGGYGQNNPYASSNPYESTQQSNPYANQAPRYQQSGRTDVEMQPLQNQDPFSDPASRYGTPQQARNPHAILNDCREVSKGVDELDGRLTELQRVQRGFVTGTGATNREVDAMGADIMSAYRSLGDRVRKIKSQPDAGLQQNLPQVNALDRRIKNAINNFQKTEAAFRKEVQEQQRRQYLIVRPDATEAELREATEGGGDTQIFQQALLQGDRQGQARSALRNVQQRHEAIAQIEKTMMELAQLLQDLDAAVVQQEPNVRKIEMGAEDTHENIVQANGQLDIAKDSARAARRKKWYCLGLSILIILIIVIGILIWLGVTGQLGGHKNSS